MKEGKDENPPPPLFPRLHVKDRDKGGGPRAPPRNKMALYEHFSISTPISSSISISGSPSSLPLSLNNPTITSLSSASSTQVSGHERSVFSQFNFRPMPAHSSEKVQSDSSDHVKLNTTTMGYDQKSIGNANFPSVNAAETLSSTAEFSSFQSHDFSKLKNSGGKKLEDGEVIFGVPAVIHTNITPCSPIYQHSVMMERLPTTTTSHSGYSTVLPRSGTTKTAATNCSSSTRLYNASDLQLKGSNSKNLIPGQHVKNQNINNLEIPKTSMECTKKPASHLLPRERSDLKHTVASSGQDHHSSSVNDVVNVHDLNAQLHQENRSGAQQESTASSNGVSNESKKLEKRNILSVRRDSCSSPPLRDNHRSPNEVESGNGFHEDNACRLFKTVDVDRNDEISEASMVDSISGMEITTDEVVDLIGQQHFCKARRVIVNQQRAFARQVFELHRLIEVQKLIAATPDMLLEDYLDVNKTSEKASLAKKLPTEIVLKPETRKPKSDSKDQNQSPEHADENTAEKHHSLDGTKEILAHSSCLIQHSSSGPFPGNAPLAAPISTDNKAGLWSFHSSLGNQWLVPVMSPSEGLIYKPYPGPFPPNTGGFMPPIYGGCAPISLPPFEASFPNPALGTSATHLPATSVHSITHPITHSFLPPPTYFPSYCMPPALNPVNSTTAFNPSALPGVQMLRQTEFSNVELNGYIFSQHQNDLLKHQDEASSSPFGKLRASKDSVIQVSTASNLSVGMQESNASEGSDALPIFPVDLFRNGRQTQTQAQTRQVSVIRVVPHNPISATESAARIFQCIQQERQQCDTTL